MLDLVHDRLQQKTNRRRGLVEESLAGVFQGPTVLDRAARHLLFGEGKRVRASLALIGMEAAGGSTGAAVQIAVAFELLHTASLIHDDIMDSARVRRGRECVHRVFGTPMAITAGDALIFEAYRHVLLLGEEHPTYVVKRILEIFTECAARACRGQAHDVTFPSASATMREYLTMVRAKTGSMIEAPLASVAILADAPPSWYDHFREYGRCLGIAFQLVDDVIEYLGSEDKSRKTLGHDLPNGGGSAMLIFCRNTCDARARRSLNDAVRRVQETRDVEALETLRALFRKHGAVDFAQRLCAKYVSRALRALDGIGLEPARGELEAIARILGDWEVPSDQRRTASAVFM